MKHIKEFLAYTIILIALCMIAFYKEGLSMIWIMISFVYLFVLPGWFLLLKYDLHPLYKYILAIPLSMSIVGTISYYIALIGFPIWYHGYVLPALLCGIGYYLSRSKIKTDSSTLE